MPVYKKSSHGKIHLYGGQGKDQPYIGPLDDPQKWDKKIARETLERDDEIFDDYFQKYIDNVLLLSLYKPEPERKEYLSRRTAELLARLRRIGEEKDQIRWKLIEDVAALAMKSSDKDTVEKISKELKKRLKKND